MYLALLAEEFGNSSYLFGLSRIACRLLCEASLSHLVCVQKYMLDSTEARGTLFSTS